MRHRPAGESSVTEAARAGVRELERRPAAEDAGQMRRGDAELVEESATAAAIAAGSGRPGNATRRGFTEARQVDRDDVEGAARAPG